MRELVIDGKKYQKASEIARNLGYTSDYVGQLCRSGKVSAQQIGRSWYVEVDSIHAHKKTRYRSNETKSRQAVQEYKKAQKQQSTPKRSAPVRHISVSHYETDDTDLIPGVASRRVPEATTSRTRTPEPQNETAVAVKSVDKKSRKYAPAEKPDVKFAGSVQVAEAEADSPTPEPTAPKPASTTSTPASTRKPAHSRRSVAVQDQSAQYSPVAVAHRPPQRQRRFRWVLKPLVILLLVTSFVVVTHGLQRSYQYEGQSVMQMYTFDTQLFTEKIPKNIVILFSR